MTFIPALPPWLNSFLINIKFYRVLPHFGMLTHSIARLLDKNKEFDVDAFRFKMRYKTFMLRKGSQFIKTLFSLSWLRKKELTIKDDKRYP